MRAVFIPLVAALAFVACNTPRILTPGTGPGTAYPCGVNGVVCLTPQGRPSGFCCDEHNVCGGEQPHTPMTCPVGACCYVGVDSVRAPDAGR